MPKKKVDKQGKAEVQSDQPDMAQKILKALEVTEGAISAVSPETVPSEKPKAKLQQKPKALTKTKKAEPKDIVTRMSDPYYMRVSSLAKSYMFWFFIKISPNLKSEIELYIGHPE